MLTLLSSVSAHLYSFFAPAIAEHDSEVYARLLMTKKLGFPLWVPRPPDNLPKEYRKNGVSIGDVGIITSGGIFEFLFNVCLPANHEINGNRVPDNFQPLERPDPIDILEDRVAHNAGSHVSSRSIERLHSSLTDSIQPPNSRVEFSFQCSAPEGAILTLPEGGSQEDLRNVTIFREYAAQNVESWYRYVNGNRGREATNGSIYLVTGCDKAKSWGTASFSNVLRQGSFPLTFTKAAAAPVAGGNAIHTYSWQQPSFGATRAEPPMDDLDGSLDRPHNQCLFLRGFKVSLSQGLWAALFGPGTVSKIVDAKPRDLFSRRSSIPFFTGGSRLSGGFGNSNSRSSRGNEETNERPTSDEIGGVNREDDVILTSVFPPTTEAYHPSNTINLHLLKQMPEARVAITHDNIWCSVIEEHENVIPNASELLRRIKATHEVAYEHGAVFLVPNTIEQVMEGRPADGTSLLKQTTLNAVSSEQLDHENLEDMSPDISNVPHHRFEEVKVLPRRSPAPESEDVAALIAPSSTAIQPTPVGIYPTDLTRSSLSPLTSSMDIDTVRDDVSSPSIHITVAPFDAMWEISRERSSIHSEGTDFRAEGSHGRPFRSVPSSSSYLSSIISSTDEEMTLVDGSADGSKVTGHDDLSLLTFQGGVVSPPLPGLTNESHQSVPSNWGSEATVFLSSLDGFLEFQEDGDGSQFTEDRNQSSMDSGWPFREPNTNSSCGRRHHRSVSGSPGFPVTRSHSPYLRPDEIRMHRRHSDTSAGNRYLRSREIPPKSAVQPITHAAHRSVEVMGPVSVDSGPRNSGGTEAMTPENPLSHHSRGQSSLVKTKVESEAIVKASQSRRKKEALFACPIPGCIATFTANHNLKNHLNSHNGIKAFKCESCGAHFTTASVLARHARNTHVPPL